MCQKPCANAPPLLRKAQEKNALARCLHAPGRLAQGLFRTESELASMLLMIGVRGEG